LQKEFISLSLLCSKVGMDQKGEIPNSMFLRSNLDSFRELFFKYHGRLVLFANKFTGDNQVSKDLVQDVFIKLWEKSPTLSEIDSPKSYLFQAVKNNCLNYNRHLNLKHSVENNILNKLNTLEKSAFFDFKDPLQSLLEIEIEEKVEAIIQSMPEKCRMVYILSRHKHLKNVQIAREMGITLKMVEKHISKALLLLRKGLAEYFSVLLIFLLNK
jgi:RNA polymerase sigma-70 factor (ECF subfamily)